MSKPKIVCLCGSTRFKAFFEYWNKKSECPRLRQEANNREGCFQFMEKKIQRMLFLIDKLNNCINTLCKQFFRRWFFFRINVRKNFTVIHIPRIMTIGMIILLPYNLKAASGFIGQERTVFQSNGILFLENTNPALIVRIINIFFFENPRTKIKQYCLEPFSSIEFMLISKEALRKYIGKCSGDKETQKIESVLKIDNFAHRFKVALYKSVKRYEYRIKLFIISIIFGILVPWIIFNRILNDD